MELPSRKERRKNKSKINQKSIKINLPVFIIFTTMVLLNLYFILSQNWAILYFTLPLLLFIFFLIHFLISRRKSFLVVNLFILVVIYLSFLEVSYRLWAQK